MPSKTPLLRTIQTLMLIPRQPYKIDVTTLMQRLAHYGYEPSLRTIQRDLVMLAQSFPLQCDGAKPQGWSWRADTKLMSLPALDPQTALTFHMVKTHMEPLLPASTLAHLKPWFDTAEGVLADHGNGLSQWPNKVRVLPSGFPRLPPTIAAEVQAHVSDAVLRERQVRATYLANGATEPWTRTIHPLALVVRDHFIYLLCVFEGYQDVRQLVLHRMSAAVLLDAPVVRPASFDLDVYLKQGEFGIPRSHRPIKLEALFLRHVAIHLCEAPIAAEQIVEDEDEDYVRLIATVPDTLELRIWLRSFGNEVLVVEPVDLREEFRAMVDHLHTDYATR